MFRTIILIIFLFSPPLVSAQTFTNVEVDIILKVNYLLQSTHVEYVEAYGNLKNGFYKNLIQELDTEGSYLLQNDVDEIRREFIDYSFEQKEIKSQLKFIGKIVYDRLLYKHAVISEISYIDYFHNDSIHFYSFLDSVRYPKDERKLRSSWGRSIKYLVLSKHKTDSLQKDLSREEIITYLNDKTREEVSAELCKIEKLLDPINLRQFVLQCYLNAFCHSFDPHTQYFSAQKGDEFRTQLSSNYFGTGITFVNRNNKFEIVEVEPFSPASDIENLNKGDEITGVKIDGVMNSPICLSNKIIYDMFYSETIPEIVLEVKSKISQQYQTITLKKELIYNRSNHTYSFILENSNQKIAYIIFPKFYSSFSVGGKSSSQDLAMILLRLKEENVDGVIIDLRFNGGGSIKEARDLLSYFVDYGPLFSVVSRVEKNGLLIKDGKKGKITNEKVIFLINTFSASASEIVAATMQKYPNSLIVGSPTYGKATGQIVLPLSNDPNKTDLGSLKITNIKIFNFDGMTHQKNGVSPDIVLPTMIGRDLASEGLMPFPLDRDTIRSFKPTQIRIEPIDSLIALSNSRNELQAVDSMANFIKQQIQSEVHYSLNFNEFELRGSLFENLPAVDFEGIKFFSMEEDMVFLKESKEIIENKSNDPILKEVFMIFEDWNRVSN